MWNEVDVNEWEEGFHRRLMPGLPMKEIGGRNAMGTSNRLAGVQLENIILRTGLAAITGSLLCLGLRKDNKCRLL